jgi:hypothetical protein
MNRVEWKKANPDKVKAQSRRRYLKHKDKILKQTSAYKKSHRVVRVKSATFQDKKNYIADIKSVGCQICGYNKCLQALSFHHIDGRKEFELSNIRSHSFNAIKIEISKCIVVCANCHMEIHSGDIIKSTKKVIVYEKQCSLPL